MRTRALAFAVALAVAVTLPGQALRLAEVRGLDPAKAGIMSIEADGRTAAIEVGEHRVVFGRGVVHWEAGELPDGRLVILADGVEHGLDMFLFDPRTGEVGLPFSTSDGLRLPSTFGDGLGSWPRAEAPHLFLFVVERGDDCVLLAVDFSQQVPRELASVKLAIDVRDFAVAYDERSQLVTVTFDGDPAVLEFPHPLAPQVIAEPRAVDFGVVQAGRAKRHTVRLQNLSRHRDLEFDLEVLGLGMREVGSIGRSRRLAAGAEMPIELEFAPVSLGPIEGALRIRSPVANTSQTIALRGEGSLTGEFGAIPRPSPASDGTAASESEAARTGRQPPVVVATPPSPDPAPARSGSPPSEPPSPRPALLPLRAAEFATLRVRRWDAAHVWVEGHLALDEVRFPASLWDGDGLTFLLQNAHTGESWRTQLKTDGSIDLWVRARAGEQLRIAVADARAAPTFVDWRRVGPGLQLDATGRHLEIEVAPGTPYWLLVVEPDASGTRPDRVLRAWRGVADSHGRARVPCSVLPRDEEEPLCVVAAEAGRSVLDLATSPIVTVR